MSSSLSQIPMMTEPQIEADIGQQFAALCWRKTGDAPEVLLITSRDTGRWVLPKGWPMKGRSPSEAAAQEAWEEAGVAGTAESESLGRFGYKKKRDDAPALPCSVEVFPLKVERLEKSYPERKQRRRKWFRAEKAAKKVAEPELRELILQFAAEMSDTLAQPSVEAQE